jgi:CBS domain-containing protein
MSSPVGTIEGGISASQAAQRMRNEVIRRLLVTENGRPVGVISVSDFIANVAAAALAHRQVVGDVMSDVYLSCRENTPVASAARAMSDTGWRSVLVVNAHGKPLGVFSGLDLLALGEASDFSAVTVSQLMHPVLSIGIDATLREAASRMIENHHHRLIVEDPQHPNAMPLGIISSFDIVAEMARPGSVWQL